MDEMIDRLMGIDKKNEIFNLWYEVVYLRFLLSNIVLNTPSIEGYTEETTKMAREYAQEFVKKRFPMCKIDFHEPKSEETVVQDSIP